LYALAVYDSALVIGGSFAALDGDTMNYVAKWIGGDYVDTCSTPVGVSEINSNDLNFSLSPNPASTQINLYSDQLITQVKIINLLGQQVYSSSFHHHKQITIDVAVLPAGVYIVETDDKENRVLKKFVKQ